MCGSEVATGPLIKSNGVSVEVQKDESSSMHQILTVIDKQVKFEETKRAGQSPRTKEMTTEFGMDPMLGGCKLGKKESCWQCYKLEVEDEMMQLQEVPNKLFCSHK